MITYIGYGFDTNDIPDDGWLKLISRYDPGTESESLLRSGREKPSSDEIREYIETFADSKAAYLRDVINSEEGKKAGTGYIVNCYDSYLVFDSLRFADESPRAKYIRSQEDFIRMIGRYTDIQDLSFGSLYEGSDWIDPVYFMD